MSDRPQGNYRDLNSCEFGGRLAFDPDQRTVAGGTMLTKGKLPVKDSYTDRNGVVQESTLWVNLIAFSAAGDVIMKFRKGDMVKVRGKVRLNTWTNKDGEKRTDLECMVWEMVYANEPFAPREPRAQGERRETGHQGRQEERRGPVDPVQQNYEPPADDEVPF